MSRNGTRVVQTILCLARRQKDGAKQALSIRETQSGSCNYLPVRVNGQLYGTANLNITIGLTMFVSRGQNGRYPISWRIVDDPPCEDLARNGCKVL